MLTFTCCNVIWCTLDSWGDASTSNCYLFHLPHLYNWLCRYFNWTTLIHAIRSHADSHASCSTAKHSSPWSRGGHADGGCCFDCSCCCLSVWSCGMDKEDKVNERFLWEYTLALSSWIYICRSVAEERRRTSTLAKLENTALYSMRYIRIKEGREGGRGERGRNGGNVRRSIIWLCGGVSPCRSDEEEMITNQLYDRKVSLGNNLPVYESLDSSEPQPPVVITPSPSHVAATQDQNSPDHDRYTECILTDHKTIPTDTHSSWV